MQLWPCLRVYEDEHVAIVEVRPQKLAQPRHLTLAREHLYDEILMKLMNEVI